MSARIADTLATLRDTLAGLDLRTLDDDAERDTAAQLLASLERDAYRARVFLTGTPERLAYSVADVADATGLSTRTIKRAIASKALKAASGDGGSVLVSAADLEAWYVARGGGRLLTSDHLLC